MSNEEDDTRYLDLMVMGMEEIKTLPKRKTTGHDKCHTDNPEDLDFCWGLFQANLDIKHEYKPRIRLWKQKYRKVRALLEEANNRIAELENKT